MFKMFRSCWTKLWKNLGKSCGGCTSRVNGNCNSAKEMCFGNSDCVGQCTNPDDTCYCHNGKCTQLIN